FAEHSARVVSAFEPDNAHIGYGGAASAAYAAWLDNGKERSGGVPAGVQPDLVIAGQAPADIAHAEALVAKMKRRPLLLALTWFGDSGPYVSWRGSDGVI